MIGEVGAALAANPPVEGADPLPGADLLKPYKEAEQVVLDVWNPAVGTGPIADAIQSLDGYILPLPTAVLSLFYVIASLLQFDLKLSKDVCDELSWSQIKKVSLYIYIKFYYVMVMLYEYKECLTTSP